MATIAFFIDHEEGHLLPTFPLARQLEERGHRVVYLTLADAADLVRRNGFICEPVLEERFPKGSLATARTGSRAEGAPVRPPTPEEAVAGRFKAYEEFLGVLVTSPTLARTVAEVAPEVDFWAPWCGPCRMVAPALEHIAEERDGKVRIAKLNIDDNQSIAHQYQVSSIPTFILFKNGQVADRLMGAMPKSAFESFLDRNI